MPAPITVNYTPNGDEWTVTVAVAGEQATRTAQATGLITARKRADQLVAQLGQDAEQRRVVHLLDGDAYAFTQRLSPGTPRHAACRIATRSGGP